MTARIRWEAGAELSMSAWQGLVGNLFLFNVIRPLFRDDPHTLTSNLPGQQQWKLDGDPEALKKGAEAWLSEFVTSLGAVFPDDAYDFDRDEVDLEVAYAPGAYVRYAHPDAGWPGDQDEARNLLTHGRLYRVAWNDIGQSRTRIGLVGVKGHGFNSVLFEPVPGEDVTDDEAAEVAARDTFRLSAPAETKE